MGCSVGCMDIILVFCFCREVTSAWEAFAGDEIMEGVEEGDPF